MRDHQRGLALGGTGQLLLDGTLGVAVQGRSGLIKDQDGRVLQQGACNRHALLFAARQLQATLAHLGGIALRGGLDEVVDARGPGGGLHLGLRGAGAAIGDVVGHRVVEQHRVLRHDADGAAHAVLGDLADVLAGDGDAARLHVIEAVQQPRQGALARARSPHHSHRAPGGHGEAHALQDGPCRVVGKLHVVKAQLGLALQLQGHRARCIGHLAGLVHQHEHARQVRQALLDLAVQRAQEVQRDVQLDHEGVDHDEVAQRHLAGHHALRGAPQHGHQGRGDDELLPAVEQAQRALALEAHAPQLLQVLVVAAGLEVLVVEVFDGLVVQQRIHGLAVRGRVLHIRRTAELGAPLRQLDGEGDVGEQRHGRDGGKAPVKGERQNAQHQQHFDQRGQDAVERVRDQRFGAAHAALDVARHAAGLALQVEAQAQGMQVAERGQGDRTRRTLRGLGEHQIAQLGEQRGGKAQRAVGQQQARRHHQQRAGIAGAHAQGIDQLLEQQRHADVRQLGAHHEQQRGQHAPFVLPQVGQQTAQGGPFGGISHVGS